MSDSSKVARDAGERLKAATKEEVFSWIKSAVNSLKEKPDLVRKSFKVCGISNNINGSEDNLVHSDDSVPFLDSNDEEEFDGFDVEDLATALDKLNDCE